MERAPSDYRTGKWIHSPPRLCRIRQVVFGNQRRKARADQGTLRISLWGFQQGPPLWRALGRKPRRPIPTLRHRKHARAPAWYAACPEGRAGIEAYTRGFSRKNGAGGPTFGAVTRSSFHRFTPQK